MQKLIRSTLIVTFFAVAGQAIAFVTQIIAAWLFGAGASMDAFLAANAVPQYVVAVLLGSLGVVFVPVFVDYLVKGQGDEAWTVASSIINLCLLSLGALTLLGMLMPDAILRLTAPGLPEVTRQLAIPVAVITWPSILATGVILLLTGIYQSQSHFGWPAAVPVIGAVASLGLMVVLARWWGIIGLAVATTAGFGLQVVLLLPILLRRGRYRLMMKLRHPGVLQVLGLAVPLVLANVVGKSSTLVERFLASSMPEGSISHLGYAFRLLVVGSLLISTGITTVVFPRMAVNVASDDLAGLRHTMSASLRFMWLAVAPATMLGMVLALPLVTIVFQRGQFNAMDTAAVAGLLQVYLLSLPAACLANITGRGFYVLKDTRTVAVLGSIESVAYVLYTAWLARYLGAVGVALGYVLFFNGSLLWQVIIIRYKTGNTGGRTVLSSFARTGLAALLGGAAAWGTTLLLVNMSAQLLLGGVLALVVYLLALYSLGSREARACWSTLVEHGRRVFL